ncbi:uncharacterized protein LOC125076101 isoform X1 [Vanessa atalanta]|uniref:uncharacterized protein LOC125076101 isoform X1 n=1 Tax=Vanessa atalanta TaxID=42275 RepID=UPI001FCD012A|nr:uncharacterized protein LOC125076101 isoform X1 [Vanessa atalanta]
MSISSTFYIMQLHIFLAVLSYFTSDFVVFSESTKDANGVELTPTSKILTNEYNSPQESWDVNNGMKSLWIYRPPLIQPHQSDDEQQSHHVVLKPPHMVTRLAKPLTFGFDPYFNKGYFEPFERRQKPVSLVAFRKNGIQPREMAVPSDQVESAEVAELQSAFNDISNLWHDQQYNIRDV